MTRARARRQACRFCGHAREPHTHSTRRTYCSTPIGVLSTGETSCCPCDWFDDRPAWRAALYRWTEDLLMRALDGVAAVAHYLLAHEDYVADRHARREARR